jgi:hypothetical protein
VTAKREEKKLRWLEPLWDRKRRDTAKRVERAVHHLVATGKPVTLETIRRTVQSLFKISISTNTILRNEEAYVMYVKHRAVPRRPKSKNPLLTALVHDTASNPVALRSKISRLRRESKDALIHRLLQLEKSVAKQAHREDNLREEVLRLSLESRTKGKTK